VVVVDPVSEQPDRVRELVVLQDTVEAPAEETQETKTPVTVAVLQPELLSDDEVGSDSSSSSGGPVPSGKQRPKRQGTQIGSGGTTQGIKGRGGPGGGGGGGEPVPGGKQRPKRQGIQIGSGGTIHGIKSWSEELDVLGGGPVIMGGSVLVAPGIVVRSPFESVTV
jgi:hypothetical protein